MENQHLYKSERGNARRTLPDLGVDAPRGCNGHEVVVSGNSAALACVKRARHARAFPQHLRKISQRDAEI